MRKMMVAAAAIAAASAGLVSAQEAVTYAFDGSFDDATFGVESAIVDRGLVVDHVSHVGDMLNRTAGDVGAEETLFDGANIYQFCSAVLSREVMEADPMNLIHCPYGVFVSERGGRGDDRLPDLSRRADARGAGVARRDRARGGRALRRHEAQRVWGRGLGTRQGRPRGGLGRAEGDVTACGKCDTPLK